MRSASPGILELQEIHGKARFIRLLSNEGPAYELWEFENETVAIDTNADSIHEYEDEFEPLMQEIDNEE